jgi:hypothetical protein
MDMREIVSYDNNINIGEPTSLNVHQAVRDAIGQERWESPPYKRLRQVLASVAETSTIIKILSSHPSLSMNAILSLVYYTSDVRRFNGKKADNIFALLNESMSSGDGVAIARWRPFVYYMYEAKKHLPKYSGNISLVSKVA